MITESRFEDRFKKGLLFTDEQGGLTKIYLSEGRHLTLEQILPGQKKVFLQFEKDKGILPFALFYKFLLLHGKEVRTRMNPRLGKQEVPRMDVSIVARHVAEHPFPYSFHPQSGITHVTAHWIQLDGKPFLEFNVFGSRLRVSLGLAEKVVRALPRIQTQKKRNFLTVEAVLRDAVRRHRLDGKGASVKEIASILSPVRGKKSAPKTRPKIHYQNELFPDFSKEWPRGKPTRKIIFPDPDVKKMPKETQHDLFGEKNPLAPVPKRRRRK